VGENIGTLNFVLGNLGCSSSWAFSLKVSGFCQFIYHVKLTKQHRSGVRFGLIKVSELHAGEAANRGSAVVETTGC
jgi:hypothetical protein